MLALLLAGSAHSQSLADATAQAWARHPQAIAMAARVAEAQARTEVANGFTPGPASVSVSSLNDRQSHALGRQEWEIEVAAPLWLSGQRAARQAEAEGAVAEVAARRQALRLQIAGEVREAWWAVAGARTTRDLAARRIVTARALEADVLRRFKVGDLARVDANLAKNERVAAEAEQLEAEAALRQAEQAYRSLTGDGPPAVLAAESSIATREPGSDHPQIAAAAASARSARARLRVAGETRREAPELAVRVVRDRATFNEPYGNAIGVKLTIPFSSGAHLRQERSAAQAEASQADAELALAQRRVELDIERARLDFDASLRQLEMAATRRDLTADNLALAEKSFSLGEADLPALLRARASAYDAEAFLNRQRVARDAAQSRRQQAQGVLP